MFVENPWYQALFDDYRELRRAELPPGMASGCEFGSVCINTMFYLPWLVGQCRAAGVEFRRGRRRHPRPARRRAQRGALHGWRVDHRRPGRWRRRDGLRHDARGRRRHRPRRHVRQGRWESQPDPSVAVRIMRRAVELVPELTDGRGFSGLDIVRHAVGLRPFREGGVRIEKERVDGVWVVHNYGHSGWGYQGSYGCAERVVELVDEIRGQAKL
jgi:D-amino-acid oxidase